MGQRLISRSRTRARERGVRSVQTMLEDGDPASTIVRLAKGLHVDMLFLGSRGLGGAKVCSWAAFRTRSRTWPSARAYR
jgi:nucleotide-binding universal stress UspA family protein